MVFDKFSRWDFSIKWAVLPVKLFKNLSALPFIVVKVFLKIVGPPLLISSDMECYTAIVAHSVVNDDDLLVRKRENQQREKNNELPETTL